MNVRGAGFHCFSENGIDQTDDWSIVFLLQKILGFRHGVSERGQVHVIADAFHHLHRFRRIVLIGGIQGLVETVRIDGGKTGTTATDTVRFRQRRMGRTGPNQNNRLTGVRTGQDYSVALGKSKRKTAQRSILRLKFSVCGQGRPRS